MHSVITQPYRIVLTIVLFVSARDLASAAELQVISVEPATHSLVAPVAAPITIHFDQPVAPDSITSESFSAFGRWSGAAGGSLSFADGDQTVKLHPNEPLFYGEQVMGRPRDSGTRAGRASGLNVVRQDRDRQELSAGAKEDSRTVRNSSSLFVS